MAGLCRAAGCDSLGPKKCGGCKVVTYCSEKCQREDRKVHKLFCLDVNKLPTTFTDIFQIQKDKNKTHILMEILHSEGRYKEEIILTKTYQAYLECQFGVPVEGKTYSLRSNGDQVQNLVFVEMHLKIARLNALVCDPDAVLYHAKAARRLLDHRDRSDDHILSSLFETEKIISVSYMQKKEFDIAEDHLQSCLMFARLMKYEDRVTSERDALSIFRVLRVNQHRNVEALDSAEKAYVVTTELHGPDRPEVQETSSDLIDVLIRNGDYSRAGDYCRMNYENMIDPSNGIDQKSDIVAVGMMQLAAIWLRKPPVEDEETAFALAEEAEDMMRKACKLAEALDDFGSDRMAHYTDTLGRILLKRGKYTEDTRNVLNLSLVLERHHATRAGATDGRSVITPLEQLAHFHYHMSANMPDEEGKERELVLRDGCLEELQSLGVKLNYELPNIEG